MKKLFLAAVALMICAASYAQNETKTLEERVASLEKKSVDWNKINRYVSVSGYVIGGYDWNDAGTSTFKLKNVNLSLFGNLYKGDYGTVDYKIQLALAGSPKVIDAFTTYMPVKEFGMKFGQFKSPLTYENSMRSPTTLEFINYSLAVQRLARMSDQDICGLSASGRDLGFEFLGSALHRDGFSIINYELAIFNGYKLNTTDNNKSKDIVGRLIITPVKPLSLFGYFQRGEGAYPTFNDVTQKLEPQDIDKYLKMHRYGGGFSYTDYWGFARAEIIGGKTGNIPGGIKSAGGYFAAGANLDDHWKLVARYDYIDENLDSKKINEMDYTAGITYAPLKNVDLKLNYTYRQLNGGFQDKNCVYVQLTIKF
ncbi:MAG: hypothetical protein IK103_00230 [Bacteroidales bacterium]|nr:hypothetical protein [Bacteroidales bacterium]